MPLENGRWRVVYGDCLWNIAKSVYNNAYRWKDIANANGISQSNPVIYPGQTLNLPGVNTGSGSIPSPDTTAKKVTKRWFALDAGSERSMFAAWSFDRENTDHYEIVWYYDMLDGAGWRIGNKTTTEDQQSSYTAPDNAKRVELDIKPVSKTYQAGNSELHYWNDGEWIYLQYYFSNNPPKLPNVPDINIDSSNTLTVTLNNIDEDINANSIEIAIYQNDTTKYSTAKVPINLDARFVKYVCTVAAGYNYKVRCRAVRGNIYGGWTDFTSNEQSRPNPPLTITTLRPQIISEQMSKEYGIFVEWPEVSTAKTYEVQWTTNIQYFESSNNISSKTTEEGKGPRLLVTNIEIGHEYFFRVRSINDKGSSQTWSEIKSIKIGSKPSAPTTWSNTSSCIIGEDLNLYWTHNSTDGSIETYARLNIKIIDSANPTNQPMEYTKVIPNDKPEDHKNDTSVYTINASSDEWALVKAGFIIKWKVQTAGIDSEYSEWSVEREVNMYAKPELELEIKNQNGETVDEINAYPFYISVLAKPATQIPISYYLEIISEEYYETADEFGNLKIVNAGDKVYQKYYDPETNAWRILADMNPGNIDLKNGINYSVNCTVSMNSGLTASTTQKFKVYFDDIFYNVYADVELNKETLEAAIHPYCREYYREEDGSIRHRLTENCSLSVYRREYDGSFTEIAKDINNEKNIYVTDPHPSLDYARYRIIAKSNETGSISYSDIPAVKFGEPSLVIQWSEKWSNFEINESPESKIEPQWSGSMLKLPYNIDMSINNNVDTTLVEYAGRKRPVSYYGTQLGEKASFNIEIPSYDKETLYAIRRLSAWTGDVYIREPSGIGYWANISLSYNIKHLGVTIPVSFSVTRVEGGM